MITSDSIQATSLWRLMMAVLGRLAQIMVVHVDHPDTSYMVSIVVLVSYMCFGVSDRLVKTYRLCYLSFYELALAISLFMLGNVS